MFFVGTKITAGAATEPSSDIKNPYYIRVDVTDLSKEKATYRSCNNTEGYIVVPTIKQDGTNGELWYAKVKEGEWDHESQTFSYYWHSQGSTTKNGAITNNKPINGFPKKLLLVTEASESSKSYIRNWNASHTTRLKFEVFVSGDGKNYTSVGDFHEDVLIYGYFDENKDIDLNMLQPHPNNIYNIDGADTVEIPLNGSTTSAYNCHVFDQYNARWYKDNANVTFSVPTQNGVSIDNNGILTVSEEAAYLDKENPRNSIKTTITAKVSSSNQIYETKTKDITLKYPNVEILYMDDTGKQLYGPFTIPLYTSLSEWEHTVDIPKKDPDKEFSYEFEEWKCSSEYPYAFETIIYTASYKKIPNKVEENQQVNADVKVSAPVGTPFYVDNNKYLVTGEFEVSFVEPKKKSIKKLTIPASVQYGNQDYAVVGISDNAFKSCKKLTKVTIPATVKEIGKNAFNKCIALKKIVIPAGVEKIGAKAFNGCESLKTITVKSTQITSVGKNAFKGIAEDAKFKYPKSKKVLYLKLFEKKKVKTTKK